MDTFSKTLNEGAAIAKLPLSQRLNSLLTQHWQLVRDANHRFNLTAITDEQAAADKHYLDCLIAAHLSDSLWPSSGYAADLGSGGGFPGLVLAAAYPARRFVLLESARKKTDFLNDSAAALDLGNVSARPLRAEEAGQQPQLRGCFDCIMARAVAELAVLAEYALPLLRLGGVFLAWKGPEPQAEIAAAAPALAVLGGELLQSRGYTLPFSGEGRTLTVIGKTRETPQKYPRRSGMPRKKPL
ncbi:MAG: 16S rRNA (guanine(527)-N(7))-methyltransferase RsmG [Clostridia bacterium]|nr:16S rRNA (guanine(527)-N(7))-methyltransferase RsmG [Clostridia bacterium]